MSDFITIFVPPKKRVKYISTRYGTYSVLTFMAIHCEVIEAVAAVLMYIHSSLTARKRFTVSISTFHDRPRS